MKIETCNALLHTKALIGGGNIKCYSFEPDNLLIQRNLSKTLNTACADEHHHQTHESDDDITF